MKMENNGALLCSLQSKVYPSVNRRQNYKDRTNPSSWATLVGLSRCHITIQSFAYSNDNSTRAK